MPEHRASYFRGKLVLPEIPPDETEVSRRTEWPYIIITTQKKVKEAATGEDARLAAARLRSPGPLAPPTKPAEKEATTRKTSGKGGKAK